MTKARINRNFWPAALLTLLSTTSIAGRPPNITPEEIALLPNYCPYTQGFQYGIKLGMNNHPMAERWHGTIGPAFMDLHHYCWALIELQRASKRSTPDEIKKGLRLSALGNLWYVINKGHNDLALLPEIYTWIGRTELQLERPTQADTAFKKAREIKPNYWPAYYHWGEHLFSNKNNTEARHIVIEGLKHSPTAKPLQELLRKLN